MTTMMSSARVDFSLHMLVATYSQGRSEYLRKEAFMCYFQFSALSLLHAHFLLVFFSCRSVGRTNAFQHSIAVQVSLFQELPYRPNYPYAQVSESTY